jgi:beta-1,2-mannobiose phosphorylase / 1,2-beta-oligomannan phosphorylase
LQFEIEMPPRRKTAVKERTSPRSRKTGPHRSARVSRSARSLVQRLRLAAAARVQREKRKRAPELRRHEHNPIITPREGRFWEMKATFNPGAVYADRRVHLLYRAIGGDDVSVLGYASSADGATVSERSEFPAFVPDSRKKEAPESPVDLSRIAYLSGGGWNGGAEDPRVTLLGDRVYLLYTAFDGWGSVRIALSSISLKDFLEKRWRWKTPALISPPGEIHKNWVLFPEKINGKFALLHSISPDVEVAYFDDLAELEEGKKQIESHYDRVSRTGGWDSWVRGAGPPPIKTKLGWLLFYHAMDMRDPNRYKIGAMVLDANDPTKVIYRSRGPILEPDAHYENTGFKAGVVYSCGAVVKDGELYVYYGGGDAVTCVAMANLDTFLEELKRSGAPRLRAAAGRVRR